MTALDELLSLLPDNDDGEISAADMRTIVTELFNYTLQVQETQGDLVVNTVPAIMARADTVDARLDALEAG